MSKTRDKIDRPFLPVAGLQADGNIRKQNFQYMNAVLQNMNGNWKLLL